MGFYKNIAVLLSLLGVCSAWYRTNFTVNSKLSTTACGNNVKYFPESHFELWATWPWLGVMYYNGTGYFKCNAILIHPEVALTSLDCMRHVPEVELKDHLFVAFSTPGQTSFQNVSVVALDSDHGGYNSQKHAALLKLSTPIVTSRSVQPICMWEEINDYNKQVSGQNAMGVGADLENMYDINRLRVYQAPIRILSDEICQKNNPKHFNSTIRPNICYVYLRDPKECLDIGSAVMLPRLSEDGSIVWYLRGLITMRGYYCERYPFMPAFDIGQHRRWIESHFVETVEESPQLKNETIQNSNNTQLEVNKTESTGVNNNTQPVQVSPTTEKTTISTTTQSILSNEISETVPPKNNTEIKNLTLSSMINTENVQSDQPPAIVETTSQATGISSNNDNTHPVTDLDENDYKIYFKDDDNYYDQRSASSSSTISSIYKYFPTVMLSKRIFVRD